MWKGRSSPQVWTTAGDLGENAGEPAQNRVLDVDNRWNYARAGGAAHDLHPLAAVPGDLELAEPGHRNSVPHSRTHEEDLQVVDVLGLVGLDVQAHARGGPERGQPEPGDQHGDHDRAQHDPHAHGSESTHGAADGRRAPADRAALLGLTRLRLRTETEPRGTGP